MRNVIEFYKQLVGHLEADTPVAWATVISRFGSGPREPGAAMLIGKDGKTFGTVGGGGLEAQVVDLAGSVLDTARPVCKTYLLTDESASEEGMLCGGEVEILIHPLSASELTTSPSLFRFFQNVLEKLESGRPVVLTTSITRDKNPVRPIRTGMGWVCGDGFDAGTLDLTGIDRPAMASRIGDAAPTLLDGESVRYFIQPLHPPDRVFIFGAGHVGEALAPVCAHVGFFPIVVDDRTDFANSRRFPDAGDVRRIDRFEGCFKNLVVDGNSYIVIVTRGHIHDHSVLSQALGTKAKYIGMIGSLRKRDTIYAALRETGVSHEDLHRVRCPIGLDIGDRTPAEIAVSIVAEMIAVRAGHPGTRVCK